MGASGSVFSSNLSSSIRAQVQGDGRRQRRPLGACRRHRPPRRRQRPGAQVQEEDLSGLHDAGHVQVGAELDLTFFTLFNNLS